jgi:hypothetical protein
MGQMTMTRNIQRKRFTHGMPKTDLQRAIGLQNFCSKAANNFFGRQLSLDEVKVVGRDMLFPIATKYFRGKYNVINQKAICNVIESIRTMAEKLRYPLVEFGISTERGRKLIKVTFRRESRGKLLFCYIGKKGVSSPYQKRSYRWKRFQDGSIPLELHEEGEAHKEQSPSDLLI